MFDFLKDTKKHEGTTEKDIEAIEAKYSIVFPEIVKSFYLDYDGNKIKLCRLEVEGYSCEVAKIIPINGSGLTFEKIVENDREDGLVSSDLYPIAGDRGGDLYYWSSKTGRVYLVLSEDIENPFEISKTVKDFFELLNKAE